MNLFAIFIGGGLGALSRYGIAQWLSSTSDKFPFATLMANILGSFLIGVFFVLIYEKNMLSIQWRPFVMVGFLGALTTFSTFSLETVQLFQNGMIRLAFLYLFANIILNILAVLVAIFLTQKII